MRGVTHRGRFPSTPDHASCKQSTFGPNLEASHYDSRARPQGQPNMDTYQFSKVHRAACLAYSPGSTFIATALLDKVHVRSTSSLESIRSWTCVFPEGYGSSSRQEVTIEHLAWSSAGSRLLAFSSSAGLVWVFDMTQDDVVARIGGDIVKAEWGEEDLLAQSERVSVHRQGEAQSSSDHL